MNCVIVHLLALPKSGIRSQVNVHVGVHGLLQLVELVNFDKWVTLFFLFFYHLLIHVFTNLAHTFLHGL